MIVEKDENKRLCFWSAIHRWDTIELTLNLIQQTQWLIAHYGACRQRTGGRGFNSRRLHQIIAPQGFKAQ